MTTDNQLVRFRIAKKSIFICDLHFFSDAPHARHLGNFHSMPQPREAARWDPEADEHDENRSNIGRVYRSLLQDEEVPVKSSTLYSRNAK